MTTIRPARITIVHEDRPLAGTTATMVAHLRDRGVEVDVLTGTQSAVPVTGPPPPRDLYVLKHSDPVRLSLAAALHAAGERTFNPYPVVAACRDKAVVTRRLAAAGLPVPGSHLVADPLAGAPLLQNGALVVKPTLGSKGRGVTVAHTSDDLAGIDPAGGPFLLQRHHPGDGLDRKLYRIGDQLFCVGRPWPATTPEAKQGRLLEVDATLQQVGFGVGDALGIDVYGADVVIADGRPWLVDVSAFPGFKGVPDAGHRLAERTLGVLASTMEVPA